MNFGEWKAELEYRIDMMGYRLYLYQHTSEGRVFLKKDGERMLVKPNVVRKQDDLYFAYFEDDTLQAVVEAFAKKGVKPSDVSKAEGLLEATKLHLADMRTLVFEPAITVQENTPQPTPKRTI